MGSERGPPPPACCSWGRHLVRHDLLLPSVLIIMIKSILCKALGCLAVAFFEWMREKNGQYFLSSVAVIADTLWTVSVMWCELRKQSRSPTSFQRLEFLFFLTLGWQVGYVSSGTVRTMCWWLSVSHETGRRSDHPEVNAQRMMFSGAWHRKCDV